MFVRVAVPIPSDQTFIYAVPQGLESALAIGKRVLVPFGKRRVTGFIIEVLLEPAGQNNTKEILDLPDPEPLFDGQDLALYEWIARYYLHPLGKVLTELLPGGISVQSERWLCRVDAAPAPELRLSPRQKAILEHLAAFPKGLSLSRLRRALRKNDIYGELPVLEAAGLLISSERLTRPAVRTKKATWVALRPELPAGVRLTARQAGLIGFLSERGDVPVSDLRGFFKSPLASLRILEGKGVLELFEKEISRGPGPAPDMGRTPKGIVLNGAQRTVLAEILQCIASRRYSPCLLHGVTGSGKTEIYLRAIADVLGSDGGAIYLVPEIALTAQLLSRVGSRFPGSEIAVLHSGISQSARYDQWKRIRRGDIRVVVGARSALFAPVRNLRLVVVDEEHDASYKQDDRLRYNARDLAMVRGRLSDATVILGSATPAIQSYFHAAEGRYRCLRLPARIHDRPLPRVEVVDLRTERNDQGLTPLLSRTLVEAMGETLARGQQTLLFLNRRGFHTYRFCPDCGHVFSCPNCDISLTHHAAQAVLKCHHCDYTVRITARCPSCEGSRVR
ncbi:MAG: primosomal protein N', partial [Thermodesulfobacteriota bacterium]